MHFLHSVGTYLIPNEYIELDVVPPQDRNTFHRFDKFNAKYNPIGESRLRYADNLLNSL